MVGARSRKWIDLVPAHTASTVILGDRPKRPTTSFPYLPLWRERGTQVDTRELLRHAPLGGVVVERGLVDARQGAGNDDGAEEPDHGEAEEHPGHRPARGGAEHGEEDARQEQQEADRPDADVAQHVLAPGAAEQLRRALDGGLG